MLAVRLPALLGRLRLRIRERRLLFPDLLPAEPQLAKGDSMPALTPNQQQAFRAASQLIDRQRASDIR